MYYLLDKLNSNLIKLNMKERTNIQNKSLQEEVTIEKQGKLLAESDSISKY